MRRFINVIIAFLPFVFAGCGEVTYQTNPRTGRLEKVKRVSSLEEGTYDSIDSELYREKKHEPPSAGTKTWREYWEWRISLWRKYNNQKYEAYFYQRRKELGLKDLKQL